MSNSKQKMQVLPGLDGIPFRLPAGEQVPFIKQNDARQPVEVWDGHVRVFELNDSKDLKDYAEIIDNVAKGLYIISAEERHWCDKNQNFTVFLRWLSRYMEMPKGRTIENGQSTSFT